MVVVLGLVEVLVKPRRADRLSSNASTGDDARLFCATRAARALGAGGYRDNWGPAPEASRSRLPRSFHVCGRTGRPTSSGVVSLGELEKRRRPRQTANQRTSDTSSGTHGRRENPIDFGSIVENSLSPRQGAAALANAPRLAEPGAPHRSRRATPRRRRARGIGDRAIRGAVGRKSRSPGHGTTLRTIGC